MALLLLTRHSRQSPVLMLEPDLALSFPAASSTLRRHKSAIEPMSESIEVAVSRIRPSKSLCPAPPIELVKPPPRRPLRLPSPLHRSQYDPLSLPSPAPPSGPLRRSSIRLLLLTQSRRRR